MRQRLQFGSSGLSGKGAILLPAIFDLADQIILTNPDISKHRKDQDQADEHIDDVQSFRRILTNHMPFSAAAADRAVGRKHLFDTR
jgi:hypothetical protein